MKPPSQNQSNPSIRFDKTPICDRQTATTNSALALGHEANVTNTVMLTLDTIIRPNTNKMHYSTYHSVPVEYE